MENKRRQGCMKLWECVAALLFFILIQVLICSAAEQPKRGGTIVLAYGADPSTLNMAMTYDGNTGRPMAEVFEGLVELDRDGESLPGLADSWEISPDDRTITFNLAKNVKWHDGKSFSSKDVKFSLTEVVGKYHPQGMELMKNIKSIETPNDNTVVFHMQNVYPPLFTALVSRTCPIIPRHLYEGTDILKNPHNFSDPVGTGPFKFKEWMRGDHLTLVRNDNYRKPGLPYLDRIIFKVIKDMNALCLAFEKGEVDFLDYQNAVYTDYMRLSSLPNVTTSPIHGFPSVTQIALNQKDNKILANLKVRQAIYHAIDRQFICEKARYGLNPPLNSPIPAFYRDLYNPNVKKYEYNLSKANKLLDEAGYPRGPNGVRFKIRLTHEFAFPYTEKASQMIKPMLREVGIDIEVMPLERAVVFDKVYNKYDFDMFVGAYGTGGDPAVGISRLYVSSEIRPVPLVNVARYSNPEVDRLFDEGASTMDRKKRAKAYYKVQEILTEELPYIWLFESAYDTNLVKSTFKNCFQRILGQRFAEVWWVGGK